MKKRPEPQHPGDMLKQARIRAGYEPRVVIAKLAITNDMFEALEAWEIDALPDDAHLIPILKRHTAIVSVDYDAMTKRFPRALKRSDKPSEAIEQHATDQPMFVFSSILKVAISIGVIVIVIGYLLWQGSNLSNRPRLDIFSPTETVVTTEFIELKGISSQGSQVFVNGTSVLVDENGEFTSEVVLQSGPNTISVRAVNNVGAEREEVITLIRQ